MTKLPPYAPSLAVLFRNLQRALESHSAIRNDKRTQIGSIDIEIKFLRLAIPRFQVGRKNVVCLQTRGWRP